MATLSVLVVRISLLEDSKIHEKVYKFIVCGFGGFQNVLRDACVRVTRGTTGFYILGYACASCLAPPIITHTIKDVEKK